MGKCRHVLIALVASLPLAVMAQVPVVEGGASYGRLPPLPTTNGARDAYAGGGMTIPSSAQGGLFIQLQQMQEEIASLRGMIEEQQYEIQRLKQESLERYQELDRRISDSVGAASNQTAIGETVTGGMPASEPAGAAPADPEKEKLYYDAAFDLIKAKDFDKADQAFNAFLRQFPSSRYAGNAQYWLGEISLAQGKLQEAGQAFAKVSHAYPKHNKVPDSLYKLADVERRLGNIEKARTALQQVITRYPGSSAAKLAQRDLDSLR
jgi:tol-pal system protein YbgF